MILNPNFFLQADVPEECLLAASFAESRETTTWQKMMDTLKSWMLSASMISMCPSLICLRFRIYSPGHGQIPCAQPGDHFGVVPIELGGDHQEVL